MSHDERLWICLTIAKPGDDVIYAARVPMENPNRYAYDKALAEVKELMEASLIGDSLYREFRRK